MAREQRRIEGGQPVPQGLRRPALPADGAVDRGQRVVAAIGVGDERGEEGRLRQLDRAQHGILQVGVEVAEALGRCAGWFTHPG